MTPFVWHVLLVSTCVPAAALTATALLCRASADLRHKVLAATVLAEGESD